LEEGEIVSGRPVLDGPGIGEPEDVSLSVVKDLPVGAKSPMAGCRNCPVWVPQTVTRTASLSSLTRTSSTT
jgi:hypothetical protein